MSATASNAPPADGDDSHLVEQRIASRELLRGRFLHCQSDTVRLPSGESAEREYFIHPGAVMVIALHDDGRVVLERQYRYPVGRVMIEFPAGKLDAGEDALACAARELAEETGYRAREWARAGLLHPCISYSTEFIEIWFARGLSLGERQLDEGEFLDVFSATPQELLQWSRDGRVTDSKTLTGTLWLQQFLAGAWPLDWCTPDATAVP